ncbi:MAG: prepilin peptidase [Planctomycetes bacterium]|nr:prepilin peptidase [Planctomycetota bacterium]
MQDILEFVPHSALLVIFFVLGSFFGSFLNVVIYRLPRRCMTIAKPSGSFCPKCKHKIRWFDNIPILSYIFLGGKCRDCKAKISFRYPLVEFIMGMFFMIFLWQDILFFEPALVNYTHFLLLLSHLVAAFILVAIAFIDFDLMIIPDSLSIGGAIILLVFAFLNPLHGGFMPNDSKMIIREKGNPIFGHMRIREANPQLRAKLINQGPFKPSQQAEINKTTNLKTNNNNENACFAIDERNWATFFNALFSAIVGATGLFVLSILMTLVFLKKARQYGGGMALGIGDVKLYLLFGAMLGWPALPMILILGSFIGVLFGVPLMLTKSKHVIPFGPSLVTAAMIILIFYGPILRFFADYFTP